MRIPFFSSAPPSSATRKITPLTRLLEHGLNAVKTSKYSLVNLLPLAICDQFRRLSNFYFLIVSIVSFVPNISPTSPVSTTLPLLVVVGFGLARDLWEDLQRRRDDAPTLVAVEHALRPARDLAVGDVVLVSRDDPFPADLLLLHAAAAPLCYVSTANLDGESNLKRRAVPPVLQVAKLPPLHEITVTVPAPSDDLYAFSAAMQVGGGQPTSLSVDNLLLRGSILRNTPYVYGLVLYNGQDTKLARNMRNPPSKLGGIERMMNRVVVGLFSILAVDRLLSGSSVGFRSLGTYLILFHSFVPVSMFVTLEFARIIQGWFIGEDKKMRTKGVSVKSKSNNLNESLGYVEHIFSDKTGTLTENVMRYVACSAGGNVYDERRAPGCLASAIRDGAEEVRNFVLAMAVSHDVVPEVDEAEGSVSVPDDGLRGMPDFQGESPDEVALVEAAFAAGIELQGRTADTLVVKESWAETASTYTILANLAFTSERKRMSTVLRCPDGLIRIFTKGADMVMLDLLSRSPAFVSLSRDTDSFSKEGLRTLVFGSRVISENEYEQWKSYYAEATTAIEDRVEREAEVAAMIEKDLDFVGVSAVEDKLQENVADTVQFLREAGMRFWVLTGDKRETAENIGYSSNRDNAQSNPRAHHRRRSSLASGNLIAALTLRSIDHGVEFEMGMVIDGETLGFIEGQELEELFLEVADLCKTVICARVTPIQKAKVVKLVRTYDHSSTLAIGDGGNDVSMIQEAHIGVGIKGKEGSQAARAADYSMGEFQHLRRLLAVHGRFSYIRTAGIINLSFYKNIFFTTTQIMFQFFCFASGTTFHNQWIVTAWNSMLTLAPPFLFGIFERDLEEDTVMRFPSVYSSNRNHRLFSMRTVLEFTIAYSIWHATVVFFMTYFYFGRVEPIVFSNGHDAGFRLVGLAVSTMAVPIALSKFLLSSHLWTAAVLIGCGVSFGLLWALIPVFTSLAHEYALEGVLAKLFSSPTYHLLWPIVFATVFLPDFFVIMIRMNRKANMNSVAAEELRIFKR
ncbi:unnamed protein product [Chondrus crispus]|uniref:Phospholipid-transporting ATPase n=1 Tax=Chondrus crispus TaxID=2769 RepID=R7QFL0_CHOCR|nr:unnamed protein product [Chondrus crispus]CDF36210.1 unnamed protein product [Chondrus crispus]|eukprot:XP_005716029.1 unnamed protein product [Chondrus crispus]